MASARIGATWIALAIAPTLGCGEFPPRLGVEAFGAAPAVDASQSPGDASGGVDPTGGDVAPDPGPDPGSAAEPDIRPRAAPDPGSSGPPRAPAEEDAAGGEPDAREEPLGEEPVGDEADARDDPVHDPPPATACPDGCDDGVDCTIDSCAAGQGCKHQPAGPWVSCDDGDSCGGDLCSGTDCVLGQCPDGSFPLRPRWVVDRAEKKAYYAGSLDGTAPLDELLDADQWGLIPIGAQKPSDFTLIRFETLSAGVLEWVGVVILLRREEGGQGTLAIRVASQPGEEIAAVNVDLDDIVEEGDLSWPTKVTLQLPVSGLPVSALDQVGVRLFHVGEQHDRVFVLYARLDGALQ